MDEEIIIGCDDDKEEEEEENDPDFNAIIPVQARHILCNIDRDEFITFQK